MSNDTIQSSKFHSALRARIDAGSVQVGIIGLGYVGLPLAKAFSDKGIAVLGFDVDAVKVAKLQRGESYIGHISDTMIRSMRERFEATDRFSRLNEPDVIIICVPTPLTEVREPDLTYIVNSAQAIAARLRPGQLIVLESTTYPGTTRAVVQPILEATGLKAGDDFFLAFSPEREDPGNPNFSAPTIPKVVGGLEPQSLDLATALYGKVVVRVVPVSSPEIAEACKILENTYRAINIALVNELKVLYDRMGINVWEVIDAARTKPFGFQAFYPGPGLGGHCLAGSETVCIRGRSLNTVLSLADLFERLRQQTPPARIGDVDVLECTDLETLSIDPQTGVTCWKPASMLFRRRFQGTMIEIYLRENRTLRVTDRHPMLVVEDDRLAVRFARDLKPGDCLPQFHGLTSDQKPAEGDVDVHLGQRVYSKTDGEYIHEFNNGLAGCFSSSPELLAQAEIVLHGLGFHTERKESKPHLQHMSGRENQGAFVTLLDGDRADRPQWPKTVRRHPLPSQEVPTWSGATPRLSVVQVVSVQTDEEVYSLEVPETHTFATTGGIFVHNCIPIDPFYLTWVARKYGLTTRFIELAGEINTSMPAYVVSRVADALNEQGKPIKGSKVALLGMAYKKDVDDPRESPGFELMDLLLKKGAIVSYNDPHIPVLPSMRHYPHLHMASQELTPAYLRAQDCVLIATDHSAYDWPWILDHVSLLVDTRNASRGLASSTCRIVRA